MSDNELPQQIPPVDAQNLAMLMGVSTLTNIQGIEHHSISEQRSIFRSFQRSDEIHNPGISVQKFKLQTTHGEVSTSIYKPESATGIDLGFVYYIHGGGWIFGTAYEWEEFIFDLVQRTGLAVVFPEYTLAPEKQYPAQQEQCVEVLQHVLANGGEYGLDVEKVVLACDSVGAQLASAVNILNHQHSLNIPIVHQLLLHPFLHTSSIKLKPTPLTNSAWTEQFYTAYFPGSTDRNSILASPAEMSVEEAKKYMPSTTIITADVDGVCDQGEEFARLLQEAGVRCGVLRAMGCLHDVEIFHLARESPTVELVMCLLAAKIMQVLGHKS